MTVQYGESICTLPIVVMPGGGPNLFGRDWIAQFKLNWETILWTQRASLLQVFMHTRKYLMRNWEAKRF